MVVFDARRIPTECGDVCGMMFLPRDVFLRNTDEKRYMQLEYSHYINIPLGMYLSVEKQTAPPQPCISLEMHPKGI